MSRIPVYMTRIECLLSSLVAYQAATVRNTDLEHKEQCQQLTKQFVVTRNVQHVCNVHLVKRPR